MKNRCLNLENITFFEVKVINDDNLIIFKKIYVL